MNTFSTSHFRSEPMLHSLLCFVYLLTTPSKLLSLYPCRSTNMTRDVFESCSAQTSQMSFSEGWLLNCYPSFRFSSLFLVERNIPHLGETSNPSCKFEIWRYDTGWNGQYGMAKRNKLKHTHRVRTSFCLNWIWYSFEM